MVRSQIMKICCHDIILVRMCGFPVQWMPLPKVAPDMHIPVERMVRTVKADVQRRLHAYDLNIQKLWKGTVYQQFIEDAVNDKSNDSHGLDHIKCSIATWSSARGTCCKAGRGADYSP
jgi:hypothetical protein